VYAPASPGFSRANEQNRQLATQTLVASSLMLWLKYVRAGVALLALAVGEPADRQQVAGFEEPNSVLEGQPLTCLEFVGDVK
jgi:hypothetical protein